MKSFFQSLQRWLSIHYKLIVLSFILACVCFPRYNLWFVPGLDEPLIWAFNYLADGRLPLGQHILFPHGPLAFFLYPLPVAHNLVVCIGVTLFCLFLLGAGIFKLNQAKGQENYFLLTPLLLLLLPIVDIQLLLIAITLVNVLLFHLSNRKLYLLLALFFCVFNLLIKTYGGVICILIIGGEFLHLLLVRKSLRLGLFTIGGFFFFFLLAWLLLYQNLSGALDFLVGQVELSSDNSEAVSFYYNYNWPLMLLSLLAFMALPFSTSDRLARHTWLLMLLPFFAAWKHAIARSDESHMNGLLNLLIVFSLLLFATGGQTKRMAPVALCLLAIGAFSLSIASMGYLNQKPIPVIRPFHLYNLVTNYDKNVEDGDRYTEQNLRAKQLPDSVLRFISNNTVDAFPSDYSVIPANHLNWVPRPVLHGYAAYTSWLDEKNADHIRSEKAARFLVWELQNRNGTGFTMEDIDNKYLLNDGPKTVLALLSSYRLKFKNGTYLVFEKRQKPLELHAHTTAPQLLHYNTWIDVPQDSNCITRAKVTIKKSVIGALKSLFYKGESFSIVYELEDKTWYTHKIVPKNAADGLWLNPFVLNPESNAGGPRIRRIKLLCADPRMVNPGISLAFEQIRITDPAAPANADPELYLFHKKEKTKITPLFSAENATEHIQVLTHWKEAPGVLRAPHDAGECYRLRPGINSGFYTSYLFKDSLPAGTRYIRIFGKARVKAEKQCSAVMIISQADSTGTTFWWSKPIGDFIVEEKKWNTAYFLRQLDVESMDFSRPLNVYVWNTDETRELLLDDLSLRIEGSSD